MLNFVHVCEGADMKALRSKLAEEVLADPKAREQLREFVLSRTTCARAQTSRNASKKPRISFLRSTANDKKAVDIEPNLVTEDGLY